MPTTMPRKTKPPKSSSRYGDDIASAGRTRGRRQRRESGNRKPVYIYFDESEHELVHIAASITRDSASSFGSKAVLDRAYEVIREHNHGLSAGHLTPAHLSAEDLLGAINKDGTLRRRKP